MDDFHSAGFFVSGGSLCSSFLLCSMGVLTLYTFIEWFYTFISENPRSLRYE
jgi:hypothetical protein